MSGVIFNGPIAEVSREVLLDAFAPVMKFDDDGVPNYGMSNVCRAVILNEIDFPSDEGIRTLRDVWYSSLKVVFDRLGFLTQPAGGKSNPAQFSKLRADMLSTEMTKMVETGEATYRDINVVDTSRKRQLAVNYIAQGDMPSYMVGKGIYPGIVLCTEKDTQYSEIARIARLYGCSCISSGGQNAMGATEDMWSQLRYREIDEIVFVAFTDYDGAGYDIAGTFSDQMRIYADIPVTGVRVGVTADQLPPGDRYLQSFALSANTQNKKWFAKTGGVDGEFRGIELNALKNAERVRIITDALNELVDPEKLTAWMGEAYVRKVAIGHVAERMARAVDRVAEEFAGDIVVDVPQPADLQALALSGEDEIPFDRCSDDWDEEIQERIMELLE